MLTISILMFNKVRQPLILWLVVPMSVTGMGGLAFASVLTLVAVPVLYALLFRIKPLKPEQERNSSQFEMVSA